MKSAMKTLFADTGYWIALIDPQDALNPKAVECSISFAQATICTSEMVLTEFLNHFAKRGQYLICIMGDRSIAEALAYDRHFEQAGFVALLR